MSPTPKDPAQFQSVPTPSTITELLRLEDEPWPMLTHVLMTVAPSRMISWLLAPEEPSWSSPLLLHTVLLPVTMIRLLEPTCAQPHVNLAPLLTMSWLPPAQPIWKEPLFMNCELGSVTINVSLLPDIPTWTLLLLKIWPPFSIRTRLLEPFQPITKEPLFQIEFVPVITTRLPTERLSSPMMVPPEFTSPPFEVVRLLPGPYSPTVSPDGAVHTELLSVTKTALLLAGSVLPTIPPPELSIPPPLISR